MRKFLFLMACAMGSGLSLQASGAEVLSLEASLPADAASEKLLEASAALSNLPDRAVVDLTAQMDFGEDVAIRAVAQNGETVRLDSCDFGPVEGLAQIDLPVRDNHLLVDVVLGDPTRHAANVLFCEYAPENLGAEKGRAERLTLRGCFMAHQFSIPTAQYMVLRPLPASACGLHK
ncbi:MAG: hypothetical protein AAFZ06_09620 [Pseudomonadota bacterium]